MRLLAIDTSLDDCSVAIAGGPGGTVLFGETVGRGHGERLFRMLRAASAEAGLAFADLERIAVTVGPGSFTGIRVGIAAARGLALVVGCPAVGIGSLAAIADAARKSADAQPLLAVIDARRGEFYAQPFAADGSPEIPATIARAAGFHALADGRLLVGPGAPALAAAIGTPADRLGPTAGVAIAAVLRLGRLAAPGDAPEPLYLRRPDAKPQNPGLPRQ